MVVGLSIVVPLAFFLVCLVVAVNGDESLERRSRFWVRVVLLIVIPLAGLMLVAANANVRYRLGGFAWLFVPLMVALVFVPAALFHRSGWAAGPCEDGGQGGSGPDQPPWPPNAPSGAGIPLARSEPAVARVRDHTGQRFRPERPHRPAREPERTALARPESS